MNQDIYVVVEQLQGKVADISYIMVAAARDLTQKTGGRVIGVLLGHEAQELVNNLATDLVLYVDHQALADFTPDAYIKVLSKLVKENQPRAIFLGNTSIGADVASVLSARLGLPIVNSCKSIGGDGQIVCVLCGGKVMSESFLPDNTTIITMIPGGYKPEEGQSDSPPAVNKVEAPSLEGLRIAMKRYIEPEVGDVDISRESILISVGRGIQNEDNIELVEELAEALGGVVCASRPVVDQGWLPTSRMVGKSGKSVKPKLYMALGISGAPEHVEGITNSELIIAINTDPTAPIFDVAKYGAEIDMLDLVEILIEKVEEAKGG